MPRARATNAKNAKSRLENKTCILDFDYTLVKLFMLAPLNLIKTVLFVLFVLVLFSFSLLLIHFLFI